MIGPFQIEADFEDFPDISIADLPHQVKKKFGSHYHIGHYVIKNNRVYSKLIG